MAYYRDYIRRCCRWMYVEGYVDEGLSGTSTGKRESFLRMIEDARRGRFDFILTKEISRFSRNTLDSIRFTQELLRCGVGVFFQSDNINTLTPDAELRLTILSSIAQDEVRKTSERVKFGFQRAIEKGVVLGNSQIWGYRKDNGVLIIDEEEAQVVRQIFDLYANEELGIRSVAERLAGQGVCGRNGAVLAFSTIRGILRNPKYKGFYCGGKSVKPDYKLSGKKHLPAEAWTMYEAPAAVPPIVSPALWDKANRLLESRSGRRTAGKGSGQSRYGYSGKLLCPVHGCACYRTVYRYPSGRQEVWQCREYSRHGRKGCTAPILYTRELDEIVAQLLTEQLPDREGLIRRLLAAYAAGETGVEERIQKQRRDIEAIESRKDKLLDLSLRGQLSDEEFSLRNERFNRQLTSLENKLTQLELVRAKEQERYEKKDELRLTIEQEFPFTGGFSHGVIDALLEKIEILEGGAGEKAVLKLHSRLDGTCRTVRLPAVSAG